MWFIFVRGEYNEKDDDVTDGSGTGLGDRFAVRADFVDTLSPTQRDYSGCAVV